MQPSPAFSRRRFLAQCRGAVAGATLLSAARGFGSIGGKQLRVGEVFNESRKFADKLTGRESRQITRFRQFNDQPTYHLNTCFSADSSHIVIVSRTEAGQSALLWADIASGELTVIAVAPPGARFGMVAMCQATGWILAVINGSLRLLNPTTLEEKVLLQDSPTLGCVAPSPDGRRIYIVRGGDETEIDGLRFRPSIHSEVDFASGAIRDIFAETDARTSHVVVCPTDPNLLLIDRDRPPKFGGGGDGRSSRVWILNIQTRGLIEIRPRDPNRFQIHSTWSHCGRYVYYHGTAQRHSFPTAPNGHYIGVADRNGGIVWERHFPTFFYGHVATHTRTHAIVTDALLTENLVTAIHWREGSSADKATFEILAQHDTLWVVGANAQSSHPHPHISPDGRWLSYNRGEAGRSDVCVVRLE